jgi:hypothetical protein
MHESPVREHRLMDSAQVDRIIEAIWPRDAAPWPSVWAILDAARDERIFPALQSSRLEYVCLYSGKLPDALMRAAPYLVELAPSYTFTRPLIRMGWGNSWGVFLKTRDSRNLRHHLRGFLRVQDESGRTLVFRYYDPRVLRIYLPTCEKGELQSVYGPVDSYLMEGEQGESLIEYAFDGQRLHEHRTPLVSLSDTAGDRTTAQD